MEKDIESIDYLDVSYSGVSDLIEGDKETGRKFLVRACKEYLATKKEIEDREHQLRVLNSDLSDTRTGIDNALRHLKIEKPLAIKVEEGIVVISDKAVTLETNVL